MKTPPQGYAGGKSFDEPEKMGYDIMWRDVKWN
jgi:hypothetical protein